MDNLPSIKLLVVGDDDACKATFVQALCGMPSRPNGPPPASCTISLRIPAQAAHFEEWYVVSALPSSPHGRQIFFNHTTYDAVLFVYDASDAVARSAISTRWVPEVMAHLGDIRAIEAGGRLDGEVHVRSAGVVNDMRFLWRQMWFAHSRVSLWQALREGGRLAWRLGRLVLNEIGVWTDPALDREVERVFLSTSRVPVALIGILTESAERTEKDFSGGVRASKVPDLLMRPNAVMNDPNLRAFLHRVAELAHSKSRMHTPRSKTRPGSAHSSLSFA